MLQPGSARHHCSSAPPPSPPTPTPTTHPRRQRHVHYHTAPSTREHYHYRLDEAGPSTVKLTHQPIVRCAPRPAAAPAHPQRTADPQTIATMTTMKLHKLSQTTEHTHTHTHKQPTPNNPRLPLRAPTQARNVDRQPAAELKPQPLLLHQLQDSCTQLNTPPHTHTHTHTHAHTHTHT